MRGRKVYGQSQEKSCPFCGKRATCENEQGVPVCLEHRTKLIEGFTCSCGQPLDVRKGKYGAFFLCMNCGPISWSKAEAMQNENPYLKKQQPVKVKSTKVKDDPVRMFIAKQMNDNAPTIDELMQEWDEEKKDDDKEKEESNDSDPEPFIKPL